MSRREHEHGQQRALAARFLALHRQEQPLLLANVWDPGSARLLASLGFQALASTSSGYAAALGRLDYAVSREEALAHAATLVAATELPVSADLENGFAHEPAGVAETVRAAGDAGLAGCSIEGWSADAGGGLYEPALAAERIAAPAASAHGGSTRLVLTARAENYLRGNPDLDGTIKCLQAYQQAGADVLYAPGLDEPEALRELIASVDAPVNVLTRATAPPVPVLSALGVKRISVGGAFAFAALAAVASAATELLHEGTYGFCTPAAEGGRLARTAFSTEAG